MSDKILRDSELLLECDTSELGDPETQVELRKTLSEMFPYAWYTKDSEIGALKQDLSECTSLSKLQLESVFVGVDPGVYMC